ncbi:MAG TPA: inorganic phosphate transporter [Terracidiphilus sp.]|jgi:PiT family inorganic phosphate transporter|nr:inorganic phosphate transporter [Terracidiphilus sp.]
MAGLVTASASLAGRSSLLDQKMRRSSPVAAGVFLVAISTGLGYIAFHVARDFSVGASASLPAFILLAAALFIALGFEFVNGFHDTANAVATVIYTHSLEPTLAVVLSGIFNLAGVLFSSGTVAFAVIALLPVELILQVQSGSGFAMVFALLLAAILWNLGTWWFGLPASSSHTLVGSIIGVGVANQFFGSHPGTAGVDWSQGLKVIEALVISPIIGFVFAGLLLLLAKRTAKYPGLYEAPKDNQPPPTPIRALMILTCTGVSFFHGSNDGQKGMGLIMLILIGTMPTVYALNQNMGPAAVQQFISASRQVERALDDHSAAASLTVEQADEEVMAFLHSRHLQPQTIPALRTLVNDLDSQMSRTGGIRAVPTQQRAQMRNEMYLIDEALYLIDKTNPHLFSARESKEMKRYREKVDLATKFIPTWVKVAVALALGLGTMIGWKRIVITVGERIGKQHLTYAQGASAGLVAMGTILAADYLALPVSTTHILSSGIAGTMSANGSGLHFNTVRNIATGWILTLPVAALLSGTLFWVFMKLV